MTVVVIVSSTKHLTQTKAYLEKNVATAVAFGDPMEAVRYRYTYEVEAVYTEVIMPHITGRDTKETES